LILLDMSFGQEHRGVKGRSVGGIELDQRLRLDLVDRVRLGGPCQKRRQSKENCQNRRGKIRPQVVTGMVRGLGRIRGLGRVRRAHGRMVTAHRLWRKPKGCLLAGKCSPNGAAFVRLRSMSQLRQETFSEV
jgi:hypothetical protein